MQQCKNKVHSNKWVVQHTSAERPDVVYAVMMPAARRCHFAGIGLASATNYRHFHSSERSCFAVSFKTLHLLLFISVYFETNDIILYKQIQTRFNKYKGTVRVHLGSILFYVHTIT